MLNSLAEAKAFLMISDEEWSKHVYARQMYRNLIELEPSHPRPMQIRHQPQNLRRRKSIGYQCPQRSPYRYQPLPTPKSIRLLQILGFDGETGTFHAILKTCDVGQADYVAVSYTWGPPNDEWEHLTPHERFSPRYRLLVIEEADYNIGLRDQLRTPQLPNEAFTLDENVYSIPIGQNLSDFLKSFSCEETVSRIPSPFYQVWIDAVCINQADPFEKTAQISLMGDIYSNASFVLAWLGNASPHLDTVVWMNDCFFPSLMKCRHPDASLEAFFEYITKCNPTDPAFWLAHTGLQPKERDWLTCWDVFLRFFQKTRWFRRCWILQEFCLARDCLCICGTTVFNPNFMLLSYLRTLILGIEYAKRITYNLEPTLRLFELRRLINPWANRSGSLMDHFAQQSIASASFLTIQKTCSYGELFLHWTRSRDTSLEMDRVYSVVGVMKRLLGQASGFSVIFPRHGDPLANVFTWAATWLLEHKPDLSLLSSVEPRESTKCLGLPSWVPDFSTPLEFKNRIVDFTNLGFDATLVDELRSRPPGMKVEGNLLRVAGRRIGIVRERLDPLTYFAITSIAAEYEDYHTWLAEGAPNIEQTTINTIAALQRAFFSFFSQFRFTGDELKRYNEERKKIIENPKYANIVTKFLEEFNTAAVEDPVLAMDLTAPEVLVDAQQQHIFLERQELMHSRSPFITRNGHAGWGPKTMKPGDTVWLFKGGRVPYILRKTLNMNQFTFIGECLVCGAMRGQLMTDEFRRGFKSINIV
jgi:hypothetical protein